MATNNYWAFSVLNIALSSVFLLLNIIFIKILHGRVVPILQKRKPKQREAINLFKVTHYLCVHRILELIVYLQSTHGAGIGASLTHMAYSPLPGHWRNHTRKQVLLSHGGVDNVLWEHSREWSTGPEGVGKGSTEEGTLELDLDKQVDCKEEILCAKVEQRREVVWNSLGALRSVCESGEGC